MPGSVRDYAILWVGARSGGGGNAALGGDALLRTPQHRLDGAEHLEGDADSTHLDATPDHHGLLPPLSGDVADVFRGDGTFGPGVEALADLTDVELTAPAAGDRLRYDGAEWVNSTLTWEPMVDGSGLVMLDGLGNIMRHEVAY